jgi:2-C-methyl-D-erythritol 4-phosphate cytidylyltransferase
MSGHVAAIIAAAGSGVRFGADLPKALIQLGNRTLIEHAVAAISPVVDQIIVTAPASHFSQFQSLLGDAVTVVVGGQTRSESVRAGLAAVPSDTQYVLIHDAARALASTDLANRVLFALQNGGRPLLLLLVPVATAPPPIGGPIGGESKSARARCSDGGGGETMASMEAPDGAGASKVGQGRP